MAIIRSKTTGSKPSGKILAAFVLALLSSSPAYAAQTDETAPPAVQTLSGGIGDTGMDEIAAVQQNYSLKLIFAQTNGEYLADIGVEIQDHKGNSVLKTTSPDSILLIRLLPGSYTVKATSDLETKTHKIVVRGHGLVTYYFHLRTQDSALENSTDK